MRIFPAILIAALLLFARPASAQTIAYTSGTITAACSAAQASTGTCPAGSYIIFNPGAYAGIRFLVGNTAFVANLQLYASPFGNCANFQPLSFIEKSNSDTLSMSTSAAGLYDANGMNLCNVMLVATSFTSGSVSASMTAGPAQVSFAASAGGSGVASNVNVTNTPSVNVANTPSVNVANTPSVSVSGTANVSVTNTPSVSISGTPSFNVANSPTVSVSGTPNVNVTAMLPTAYLDITDSSAHVITCAALVGVQNLSGSNQSVTLTVYDNNSASGPILTGPLMLGAGATVYWPLGGIKSTSGDCTAQLSGTPGGNGVQVLTR